MCAEGNLALKRKISRAAAQSFDSEDFNSKEQSGNSKPEQVESDEMV